MEGFVNGASERMIELDDEVVRLLKRSKEQQGYLVPIVVDQNGEVLSGRHRQKADEQWTTRSVQVKDELDRLLKIVHFNVQRRPTQKETAERLLAIAEILEKQGVVEHDICRAMATVLPYSQRHIERLLPAKYKHGEFSSVTFEPQLYNVWNFGKCLEGYGIPNYPGRIPAQIVQNVLYFFTNEGDIVVDPMAGGGTTIDVCEKMKRYCRAYDIKPAREDIQQHDIAHGFPEICENADLIFLDPPYYNMVYDLYENIDAFYSFIQTLARKCYDTVRQEGFVVLVMEDMTEKGNYCLSAECYRRFADVGFHAEAHISCPLSAEQFNPQQVIKAKEEKHMLGRNRDIYVFKKG